MTISLGRFIPGNSLFHKADPRTKIIWTIVMLVLILLCKTLLQYVLAAVFVILAASLSRIKIKFFLDSMKPILFLLIFTVSFNLLLYKGDTELVKIGNLTIYLESVLMSVRTIVRVCLLVISASLLTYTTTSVMITDGFESILRPLSKIGFPSHDVAMMMSIALRFIPIFADETDKIIKAQSARGARFDSKNPIVKIKSYVPVLIPLFVSAFKSAEDMATAMEARCYRGGEGRTKYKVLGFTKYDLYLLIGTSLFGLTILLMRFVIGI